MTQAVRALVAGRVSLVSAFWDWAILGALMVNAATTGVFYLLMANNLPTLAVAIGYGISLPYNALAALGVWRSADNAAEDAMGEGRAGPELTRYIALGWLLLLSVT